MSCSSCSVGSPWMADRRLLLGLTLAGLVLAGLPAVVSASPVHQHAAASITIADVPTGEDCEGDPDAHPGVGLRECDTPFSIASLLPFILGGVVVLVAIFAGWFLVMRRRASRPFLADGAGATGATGATGAGGAAAGSGDWWTCSKCGATNIIGSARCYSCGSWPS